MINMIVIVVNTISIMKVVDREASMIISMIKEVLLLMAVVGRDIPEMITRIVKSIPVPVEGEVVNTVAIIIINLNIKNLMIIEKNSNIYFLNFY